MKNWTLQMMQEKNRIIKELEAEIEKKTKRMGEQHEFVLTLQKQLTTAVPFEAVQNVIEEIWAEIKRMEGHSNIGKLGCVRRIEALLKDK